MADLDILKAFSITEKTQEDIETIMSITQSLPFVISYNNPEIHKIICQNMRIRQYYLDDRIFDSSKMENIDFLIYSGKVYLFISESDTDDSLRLIREMKSKDCFGSFELNIMKQNNTRIRKIIAIAKETSKIIIFENKILLNDKNKEIIPKTRRELLKTQREENNKNKDNPKYYDPQIFLFNNPETINNLIDNVKNKINDEFENNPSKSLFTQIINKLNNEKEFRDVVDRFNNKKDLKDTFNYIDEKYENFYTNNSLLDLKLGILSKKSIDSLNKCQDNINNELNELKDKFYDKNNSKNRNLFNLNIDKELESDEFQDYIYDEINKIKNLSEKMKEKKINDKKIEANKKKIKKEENLLLNTYYCIYCHINPRNAISVNCHHLVICEDCMKKTKICPRCGINIDNYHKIYRS